MLYIVHLRNASYGNEQAWAHVHSAIYIWLYKQSLSQSSPLGKKIEQTKIPFTQFKDALCQVCMFENGPVVL